MDGMRTLSAWPILLAPLDIVAVAPIEYASDQAEMSHLRRQGRPLSSLPSRQYAGRGAPID